jgi:hypothetical protein
MHSQHLCLTIFELLIGTDVEDQPTPQSIVAEAMCNMQTLIRLCYIRHGFEAMDIFIVIPLMFAGFRCLEGIGDHTPPAELELMRSTLPVVANGLYYQRQNHYLSEVLYRMLRSRMRPQEVALLKETLDLGDEEETSLSLRQAV